MKVLIIGLKHFGHASAQMLKEFNPKHTFIYLDTYYSTVDKFRFLLHLLTADCVYSINGAITKSLLFWFTLLLKKKLVMHWVGSDILVAKENFKLNKINRKFIHKAKHLTDTPWFVPELKTIGIDAAYIPIPLINTTEKIAAFRDYFNVLAYIPQGKEKQYGFEHVLLAAKELPKITFNIVGLSTYHAPLPPNIKLLGWVDKVQAYFSEAIVTVRMPIHDGLSMFVLETLLHARYSIYNQPFSGSYFASDSQQLISQLKELIKKFDAGDLPLNYIGQKRVLAQHSKENSVSILFQNLQN